MHYHMLLNYKQIQKQNPDLRTPCLGDRILSTLKKSEGSGRSSKGLQPREQLSGTPKILCLPNKGASTFEFLVGLGLRKKGYI